MTPDRIPEPAPGQIRILLADDHALFRDGVRHIFDLEDDFVVVGEAGDGRTAVRLAAADPPDVVLLDVEMPGQHVTETVRQLAVVAASSSVIILSMHDEGQLVTRLVKLGVRGYLLKSATRLELLSAVRAALQRPNEIVLSVSRESLTGRESAADSLSERERQVLQLAARAMSNAQIATRLSISEATVKRHLYNVFGKLGAISRLDAVNKYYRRGGPEGPPG